MAFDLAWLLNPLSISSFLRDYWEKQPFISSEKRSDYFDGLLSVKTVDALLTGQYPRHRDLRMVKDDTLVPRHIYTLNSTLNGITEPSPDALIDVDRVLTLFAEGTTIVLESLHLRWSPLAQLCRSLEQEVGFPCQTNVYLTPPSSKGFGPHYDNHDVLILQISGNKTWKIYENPVALPTGRLHLQEASRDAAHREIHLESGDLLYLPRGFVHEAATSDNHSLHITLGILVITLRDLLIEAVRVASENHVELRCALPLGLTTGKCSLSTDAVCRLLSLVSGEASIAQAVERTRDRFQANLLPLLDGQLVQLLSHYAEHSPSYRVRKSLIYTITQIENEIVLRFHGKKLTFAASCMRAIELVTRSRSFHASDLPLDLDDAGKAAFVARLAEEGFLTVELPERQPSLHASV